MGHGVCVCVCVLSRIQFFVTPRIVACQASLSMGFSQKEYWSGCHFLLLGIFLTQGLNPRHLHHLPWQEGSLPLNHLGSLGLDITCLKNCSLSSLTSHSPFMEKSEYTVFVLIITCGLSSLVLGDLVCASFKCYYSWAI